MCVCVGCTYYASCLHLICTDWCVCVCACVCVCVCVRPDRAWMEWVLSEVRVCVRVCRLHILCIMLAPNMY